MKILLSPPKDRGQILEHQKDDVGYMQVLSLCTGIGGLDRGFAQGCRSLGLTPRTVCMVEREAFAASVLVEAIKAGRLDECPLWFGDLGDLPVGELPRIDWVIGGYPCQPFSYAGARLGEDDERHLWPEIHGIVESVRPRGVFFENVSGHLSLGLDQVLGDLGRSGYRCSFGLFTAEEVGAPHRRERGFILGMADADGGGLQGRGHEQQCSVEWPVGQGCAPGPNEPSRTVKSELGRDVDGVSGRVDRLRALGNAVVPQQAAKAFIELYESVNYS